MRIAIAVSIAALLSGCLTTDSPIKTITSTPERALVTITGFGECETPCSVRVDASQEVIVAKAGYLPQRFFISRKSGAEIAVILVLAAPTSDVSSSQLPELQ